MNWQVIRALIIKYGFVCSRNSFRLLDMTFWPVLDLLLWGFVTLYMIKSNQSIPGLAGFMIGAIILWNVMYRAQQVVGVSFLDDVWSRNLLNLFAAPIHAYEYIAASCIMGLIQSVLVLILLGGLAYSIDSVNLLKMGLGIGILFMNLILMGWSMGMISTAAVLRFGPPAEALAWALPGLLQPISAVFYPIAVLPGWMQAIAQCVPAAHVFEGMREAMAGQPIDPHHIMLAFGLNIIYMMTAAYFFKASLDDAKERGFLVKYGT
jgi:ABC-2 type transport system permease protein